MWDASKCNLCGDCLVNCRYVDYDKDRAVAEIKLLMEGKEADILNTCTTCVACNDYCPTGADPSNLIFKMQEKLGTSPIVMVGKPVLEALAKALEGRGDSGEVISGDPDKPALSFDSFEFNQFPEGTRDSQLFRGMTVVRGYEYASLAGCVHMGGESFVEKYGQGVLDRLDRKVAYQANCATRWIPEYDAFLDEIFELVGVERPNRHYERLNAVCCTGPLIYTNRELAVDIQKKNFEDAMACGADAIITSCPICDGVLRRPSSQFGLPKIFITDLCRIALGEKPWPESAQ